MIDHDFEAEEAASAIIIGLCAAALSGAIVGCVTLGATLFIMWRIG
jgi:hypothetical protein